jgi:hypothetical protein
LAVRCDARSALQLIEAALAACPIQPFFGSAPQYYLPLIADCFARQGSALRPRLVRSQGWDEVIVEDARGARRCRVSDRTVWFADETGYLDAGWPTLDELVRAVRRYCEEGATLDQIATESGAEWMGRRPAS